MKKIFLFIFIAGILSAQQRGIAVKDTALAKDYGKIYGNVMLGTDGTYWRVIKTDGSGNVQTESAQYDSSNYADSSLTTAWKAIPLTFTATSIIAFGKTPIDMIIGYGDTTNIAYLKGGFALKHNMAIDTVWAKTTTSTANIIIDYFK